VRVAGAVVGIHGTVDWPGAVIGGADGLPLLGGAGRVAISIGCAAELPTYVDVPPGRYWPGAAVS